MVLKTIKHGGRLAAMKRRMFFGAQGATRP
jgi:hypothetical protein